MNELITIAFIVPPGEEGAFKFLYFPQHTKYQFKTKNGDYCIVFDENSVYIPTNKDIFVKHEVFDSNLIGEIKFIVTSFRFIKHSPHLRRIDISDPQKYLKLLIKTCGINLKKGDRKKLFKHINAPENTYATRQLLWHMHYLHQVKLPIKLTQINSHYNNKLARLLSTISNSDDIQQILYSLLCLTRQFSASRVLKDIKKFFKKVMYYINSPNYFLQNNVIQKEYKKMILTFTQRKQLYLRSNCNAFLKNIDLLNRLAFEDDNEIKNIMTMNFIVRRFL